MGDDDIKKVQTPSDRAAKSGPPRSSPSGQFTRTVPSNRPALPRVTVRLSAVDFEIVNAGRRILEGALGVVPGEKVVVLLDRARSDLASVLVEVAQVLGATALIFILEEFGERPLRHVPRAVAQALGDAQASILLIGNSDAELPMRHDLLARVTDKRLRHAHMLGVTRASLITGFSVDPSRVLDATRAVRTRIRPDSKLHLRSAAGSDLHVVLHPQHRWAERVGSIRQGRWENLPAGTIASAVGEVSGVFVADASFGGEVGANAGTLERAPVRFEIEGGVCKQVRSSDLSLQRSIEETLRRERELERVGVVILGTNVGIVNATGEIVCDQNMPGLHIGFGAMPDATQTIAKEQLVAAGANSDVDLDGAPIIRSGRYIVS